MEKMLKADLIKPKYDEVKEVWARMLRDYYAGGELDPRYTVAVPCPYCGGRRTRAPFVLNGFHHATCEDCSVVYVSPRLKDECLERLYSDQYYSEIYGKSMIPVFETRKELIGRRKTEQTLSFVRGAAGPLEVLDIGCGVGEVIDSFKERGHRCSAIEVNPIAVEWLRKRGISVSSESFDRYPEDKAFDVIMAWGVVEHVVDPHAFLHKARRMLKPGGVFVSEVPSGQCLLVDYCRQTGKDPGRIIMGEQHIILYSVEAYEKIHREAGLEKLHVQTNGLDVETIMKMEGQKTDDRVVFELQRAVDAYGKGDLIRGFWRRPH